MFELGGHVIDPMVRLMGRPKNVTVTLHKELPLDDKLHDNTLALLEWDKCIGIGASLVRCSPTLRVIAPLKYLEPTAARS